MSETDIKDQDGAGANSEPVQQAETPSSGGANAAEPTGADTPPVSEKKPVDPLAVAQADAARFRDQLLRTAADFDNYRKRSRREAEDAQKRGREIAIKELLPVFDNLERAAVHVESATTDAKSVSDGLRIVLKQFVDTLDKMGVKRVHAVGLPFDPSLHEAIQHMESKEPAGVIVAEVQAGYTLGDKLLRAAMVVVSKGPAETDAAAT